ncbi:MAG: hypothetical protein IH597_15840 [Bacteroidales bacterium]|nr:hypothetical protein [Bacteroidales bacterium]
MLHLVNFAIIKVVANVATTDPLDFTFTKSIIYYMFEMHVKERGRDGIWKFIVQNMH